MYLVAETKLGETISIFVYSWFFYLLRSKDIRIMRV